MIGAPLLDCLFDIGSAQVLADRFIRQCGIFTIIREAQRNDLAPGKPAVQGLPHQPEAPEVFLGTDNAVLVAGSKLAGVEE